MSQPGLRLDPRHEHHNHQHEQHDNFSHNGQTVSELPPTDHGANTFYGGSHSHPGHAMVMAFHYGSKETILFEFWRTETGLGMLLSCLLVFIIAVLYECLKFSRQRLNNLQKKRLEGGDTAPPRSIFIRRTSGTGITELLRPMPIPSPAAPSTVKGLCESWWSGMHLLQTVLHMLQVTISFMLMLIFMTFNVWLCIAVVLGAGVGYFIFCVRNGNVSDHCN